MRRGPRAVEALALGDRSATVSAEKSRERPECADGAAAGAVGRGICAGVKWRASTLPPALGLMAGRAANAVPDN